MKKIWKIIIALAILGMLGAAYGWFFVYNKPHTDYSKEEPVAVLTAQEAFELFSNHNEIKTKDMLGKVIQISGEAKSVENSDSLTIVVFVFKEGDFGDEGVRCSMLPSEAEKLKSISFPAQISIKGYCTGYNETDLLIEQCVVSE